GKLIEVRAVKLVDLSPPGAEREPAVGPAGYDELPSAGERIADLLALVGAADVITGGPESVRPAAVRRRGATGKGEPSEGCQAGVSHAGPPRCPRSASQAAWPRDVTRV